MSLCSLLRCFHDASTLESDVAGMQYQLNGRDDVYEAHKLIVPILALIKKFLNLYSCLPTASDMFRPISHALNVLKNRAWIECEWPGEYSIELFKKNLDDMTIVLEKLSAEREPPRTAIALPKPLRLYEPEFQEV